MSCVNVTDVKKFAKQGDPDSLCHLGIFYEEGMHGFKKDSEEAERWYKKAATQYKKRVKQGDAEAMFRLGNMHFYGKGMPRDMEKAKELYTDSAKYGYETAQLNFDRLMDMVEGRSILWRW